MLSFMVTEQELGDKSEVSDERHAVPARRKVHHHTVFLKQDTAQPPCAANMAIREYQLQRY
jgi:hypothetical protein